MTAGEFNTVFWKEWKEIVMERSGGAGSYRPLIMIGVLGVFMPFRMSPERFFGPFPALIYAFFSAVVVTAVIADSFAGERERHTLETLLATRLSDRAILLGKIAAAVAYGWLMAMLCAVAGTITENVVNRGDHVLLYSDWASWLILLLAPPLAAAAVATAGVLVSLRATTVRQAQQTLMVGVMVLVASAIFIGNMLPAAWRAWFFGVWVAWSPTNLVLAAAGMVLAIDLLLLLAGMARFQRARLVLD